MRFVIACLALSLAGVAGAQTAEAPPAPAAASIRAGAIVRSADGRRIGRVDRVQTRRGQEVASVIYESRMVYVPVATISAGEKGALVSSLSRAEIAALN